MSQLVTPAVLIPRFTSIVGSPQTFLTLPIDVSAYEKGQLTIWRGPLVGSAPIVSFSFLESTDRNVWSLVPSTSPDDPGADNETQYLLELTKRWLRVNIQVGGTNAGMTCWIQGFFLNREE